MTLPLKIFQAAVGGATYWVAALHPEHARELLYVVCEDQGTDPEDFEEATISECSEERARELKCNTDTERGTVSMWDELKHSEEPRVLACSEWP